MTDSFFILEGGSAWVCLGSLAWFLGASWGVSCTFLGSGGSLGVLLCLVTFIEESMKVSSWMGRLFYEIFYSFCFYASTFLCLDSSSCSHFLVSLFISNYGYYPYYLLSSSVEVVFGCGVSFSIDWSFGSGFSFFMSFNYGLFTLISFITPIMNSNSIWYKIRLKR